jgi:acyl-coenzyme A thioesterase PaaI-like protein
MRKRSQDRNTPMTAIIIDKRYCGPPNSGNGGYVCGRLARHIPGAAEVTLRAPPPLDTPLDASATDDGAWELRDGPSVVATGRATSVELTRLETASFDEACAAELLTPVKPHEHPLPTCFVCGPARAKGDGLRIFAGPLGRHSRNAVLAASWAPDPNLAVGDGLVADEFLWSALDCPTGYACNYNQETGGFDQAPLLLGRMAARIEARPRPGDRCVITAWPTGRDGRKRTAEAALHDEGGKLLAVARTTWIAVEREVQLGRG